VFNQVESPSTLITNELVHVSAVGNLEVADLASSSVNEVGNSVTENEQHGCQDQNNGNPNDDFDIGGTVFAVKDIIKLINHWNRLSFLIIFMVYASL
jgi:hypothetical protein